MNKILVLFALFFLTTCNKFSKIENTLICKGNEYWSTVDFCYKGGLLLRFNNNGTYDRYLLYRGDSLPTSYNRDGDLIFANRVWSVTSDSTLKISNKEYKILHYSDDLMVLTYQHPKEKEFTCYELYLKEHYGNNKN